MSQKRRLFFYLAIFLIISLAVYLFGLKVKTEDLVYFIKTAGFLGPFVYIVIFSLTHVIAPLSGSPVFFAGYILFKNKVQIYTYLATLLSATVNFWISKKWGRSLVLKLMGRKNMEKVDRLTLNFGVKSLILLRLFQGHLTDFISFAYGLTNMRFFPYIIVSTLAPIPWLLLWQFYIFKKVRNVEEFTIWWLATLVPLFIISVLFASKMKRKKFVSKQD